MDERRNKITSRQLMTYIIASQLGSGVPTLPARLAEIVGHDGWISVILGGIISIILSVITIKLLERYKDKSIYAINKLLYGKYIGGFLNIMLCIYLCLMAALYIRLFSSLVKITVLPKTPPVILTVFIITPGIYMVWYGLKAICRFDNGIYFITLVVYLFFLLFLKHIRITFLMPVGEAGLKAITEGILVTTLSYMGFGFTSIFYPNITDKDKTLRYVIYGQIFCMLFFLALTVVTTGFFGENMIKHLTYPILSLARSYKAPIFERIDLYFIIMWLPAISISMHSFYFGAYNSINGLFKIKKKTLSLAVLTMAFIALSRIPKDFAVLYIYFKVFGNISTFMISLLFIIGYLFSFVNTKGVQKK